MIRKIQQQDIEPLMKLWLNTTLSAHSFIPKDYWHSNLDMVKDIFSGLMPNTITYVYERDGDIKGLIGLIDNYIAGLFVSQQTQSKGIGKELINFAKASNDTLTLHVYKQNERAVNFYLREGFVIEKEQVDKKTGELEFCMVWGNISK